MSRRRRVVRWSSGSQGFTSDVRPRSGRDNAMTEDLVPAAAAVPGRPLASARRLILPLALAQFICSFAGSNMNVMIADISDDLNTTVKGVQTAITLFLLIMAI